MEDGGGIQLVHQSRIDSPLELLPQVLPRPLSKCLGGGRYAVPVDHLSADVLRQVHGLLLVQDQPEQQVVVLSRPLDSADLLGCGHWNVVGERRGFQGELDQA